MAETTNKTQSTAEAEDLIEEVTPIPDETLNATREEDTAEQENPLIQLQKQVEDLSNKYLRALADMDNMKKRAEKSVQDASNFAIANFAKELIVTLDIFDKAFANLNVETITDDNLKTFAIGMQLTQKELHKTLDKFGVVQISPLNEKFNPNFHEALFSLADPKQENGTIFEVSESGYMLKDRLLRPAKVGIIKNENS